MTSHKEDAIIRAVYDFTPSYVTLSFEKCDTEIQN
jgi:hypothetical protein